MTNIERYILELKKKRYPVRWKCSECPAKEYCDTLGDFVVLNENKYCLDIFEEWAKKEAE